MAKLVMSQRFVSRTPLQTIQAFGLKYLATPVVLILGALTIPSMAIAQTCGEPEIRQHLKEMMQTTEWEKAVNTIAACEATALPGLVVALEQGSPNEQLEAIAALEKVFASPAATAAWVDQAPQLTDILLTRLQPDADEQVQGRAAAVLGTVAYLSKDTSRHEAIAQALIAALADSNNLVAVHINAAYALGQVPNQKDPIAQALSPLLTKPQTDLGLREAAARSLADLNVVDPLIAVLQNPAVGDDVTLSIVRGLRGVTAPTPAVVDTLIPFLGASNPELVIESSTTLNTIAQNQPQETAPLLLPHLDALVAHLANPNLTSLSNTVGLLAVVSDHIVQAKPPQKERDGYLKTLNQGLQTLETNPSTTDELRRELQQAVRSMEAGNPALEQVIAQMARTGMTTLLIHSLFWLALVAVYPVSPQVQAIFFWNPKVRTIFGLGYVGLALTWIPFLRAKLFAPFRANLLAEADLDESDSQLYFAGSDVVLQGKGQRMPIMEAVPDLKGQIVLEGESGLGKTMALKYLVRRSRRLVVYLPARKCAAGVIESIRDRLQGPAQDTDFLQSLIYSGAIDICIDGLNEVTPDTRAKITLFAETYFKGNIAISTQPMDWTPPTNAKVYQLQPLTSEQIGDFLRSRQSTLSPKAPVQGAQYEQACQVFLANLDPNRLTTEAMTQTLSNPMELTVVAQMIADGKQPDLLNLQQQQYDAMASRYQYVNLNQPFPLEAFAEMAYQMRLKDEFIIPADAWFKELNCMEPYRMVLSRQLSDAQGGTVTEWRFRHEKIQDFFIVQTFWGQGNERPDKHLGDPRFRGVYLLLATQLPLDSALQLREMLISHAVKTKDHTVSDRFIELIKTRQPQ
ncbi:MAG: HEAT repeat domain-containing protein [Oculatellaceae cyanobacterium bins.114]|nr:HEAT repeat domain-containing protein [Oculatellaceae cyanobacterium bins.114]